MEPELETRDASPVRQVAASDAADRWLWLDPGHSSRTGLAGPELSAFLRQAVELFRAKDWTGGQKPGRLAVHPTQETDGLKRVAEDLGLAVVIDPRVTRGTYRLGFPEH